MKKKYLYTSSFYVALASFLLVGNGYAATVKTDEVRNVEVYASQLPTYKPLNNYGSFVIRMDQKTKLTEAEFLAKANEFFGLFETNTFKLLHSYTDGTGKVHNTYQHYVGNYPVDGQMFIVHSKKGVVTSINGTIINIENKKSPYSLRANVNRKPTISKENAATIAFKVNQVVPENVLEYPVETVFVPSAIQEGVFVLAHKVRVDDFTSGKFLSKNVFVDVEKGEVVNEVSLVAHANIPGVGSGFYRNNLPLGLSLENGKYQLVDSERRLTTFNAANIQSERDIYRGRGELVEHTSTTFPQSPMNDIHWGLANTYDYYKEVHHRDSYDGAGGEIKAFYNPVVMDNNESGFPDNAVAMSSPFNFMMFGRGSDSYFNPLVAIDVTGHEFTHLVIDNNGRGGLRYQGESGALNEGFADIFGTSIEHYAVTDADWLIGTGVVRFGGVSYMRSMENPKNNRAGGKQPSTYKGEFWANTGFGAADQGGVHTNSGVINYWYYLVSEGGSGVNDKGDDYVVSGIGLQKAEQIAFQTMMTQLGANSQYVDTVEATLTVVEDLYGVDSEEYFAVYDAWFAVGFGERRPNMGIEDFELAEDIFSMYPNPVTNGELTVLIKDEKGTVTFFNMAGQKVTQDFAVEKGENKVKIPQLKTGNYIVVYESKERKITDKIVVK